MFWTQESVNFLFDVNHVFCDFNVCIQEKEMKIYPKKEKKWTQEDYQGLVDMHTILQQKSKCP
jgi:hypothetical protein